MDNINKHGFQDSKDPFEETWDTDWYKREYKSDYRRQIEAIEQEERRIRQEEYGLKDSLTQGAKQLNWKVESEFPLCPKADSSAPLLDYFANLKQGKVFCRNSIYESVVHKAERSDDGNTLAVITISEHVKGITKGYALASITYQDGCYIHKNEGSFYAEEGAEKYLAIALGREWAGEDVIDDYC